MSSVQRNGIESILTSGKRIWPAANGSVPICRRKNSHHTQSRFCRPTLIKINGLQRDFRCANPTALRSLSRREKRDREDRIYPGRRLREKNQECGPSFWPDLRTQPGINSIIDMGKITAPCIHACLRCLSMKASERRMSKQDIAVAKKSLQSYWLYPFLT